MSEHFGETLRKPPLREGGAVLKRRESPDKSIVPPPNVVEAIEDIIHA